MKAYLRTCPLTGAVETFEIDESTGDIFVHREGDVSEDIEHNKRLASQTDGWNDDKTMRLAAEVPMEVAYTWLTKYGVNFLDPNHKPAIKRLLNSNEYRYLRIGHFML